MSFPYQAVVWPNQVTSPPSGFRLLDPATAGLVQRSAVTILTNAQIKALQTTGVQVLAAPGANLVNTPLLAVLVCNAVAASYTNINVAATMQIRYNGITGAVTVLDEATSDVTVSNLLANGLAMAQMSLRPMTGSRANFVNSPLVLGAGNNGADYTGGNAANSLTVTIYYVTVPV